MLVVKTSLATGVEHSMDIPGLDEAAFMVWQALDRKDRPHVQDAFPHLSRAEREFLISGVTPEEWREMFGDGPKGLWV